MLPTCSTCDRDVASDAHHCTPRPTLLPPPLPGTQAPLHGIPNAPPPVAASRLVSDPTRPVADPTRLVSEPTHLAGETMVHPLEDRIDEAPSAAWPAPQGRRSGRRLIIGTAVLGAVIAVVVALSSSKAGDGELGASSGGTSPLAADVTTPPPASAALPLSTLLPAPAAPSAISSTVVRATAPPTTSTSAAPLPPTTQPAPPSSETLAPATTQLPAPPSTPPPSAVVVPTSTPAPAVASNTPPTVVGASAGGLPRGGFAGEVTIGDQVYAVALDDLGLLEVPVPRDWSNLATTAGSSTVSFIAAAPDLAAYNAASGPGLFVTVVKESAGAALDTAGFGRATGCAKTAPDVRYTSAEASGLMRAFHECGTPDTSTVLLALDPNPATGDVLVVGVRAGGGNALGIMQALASHVIVHRAD